MIAPDILHVWHLGVGRDISASALVYMLKEQLIFRGSTIDERLATATAMLKAWASERKLGLKLKKLSRTKLGWDSKKYPELKSNGYDTFIVTGWLQSLCEENHALLPHDLGVALWSANHVLSLMQNAPTYLSPQEQKNKMIIGQLFMKSYLRLANQFLHQRKKLFRLRPKLHILHHIFRSNPPSRQNPAKYSTWIDEDGLKRLMRVMRMIDARTAPERLLQRFLLALPQEWQKRRVKK